MTIAQLPGSGDPGSRVPADDGMLTLRGPDGPRLLASRCGACGARAFPVQSGCGRCGSLDLETVRLPERGTLWTWTTQNFPPKDPPYRGPVGEDFTPYLVGFVTLQAEETVQAGKGAGESLCVETRLTGFGGRAPRIGEDLVVTTVTLRTDADGNDVVIPAFEPAGARPAGARPAGEGDSNA
jgi:uncharacterized OB-fold protein